MCMRCWFVYRSAPLSNEGTVTLPKWEAKRGVICIASEWWVRGSGGDEVNVTRHTNTTTSFHLPHSWLFPSLVLSISLIAFLPLSCVFPSLSHDYFLLFHALFLLYIYHHTTTCLFPCPTHPVYILFPLSSSSSYFLRQFRHHCLNVIAVIFVQYNISEGVNTEMKTWS